MNFNNKTAPLYGVFQFPILGACDSNGPTQGKIRKADLRKDILVRTDAGNMVLRRTEGGHRIDNEVRKDFSSWIQNIVNLHKITDNELS